MPRVNRSGVSMKGVCGAAVVGLLALAMEAEGQTALCHLEKILATDGAADDEFGNSVSVSGGVAVVGAPADDDGGANTGSAYVYRFDGMGWVEDQKLTASDGQPNDEFGYSVAIDGDLIVVGTWAEDDNGDAAGAAYVFRYNGSAWVEEDKLTASDGAAGDNFGWSVAIDGDVIAVGALGDDDNGSQAGAAYVFRYNGSMWVEEDKLLASDGATSENFGYGVAVSGDLAVAGAPNDNDNGAGSGSAYVFRFNGSTWDEEDKLLASDGVGSDHFGHSVAAGGDTVMVGAWGDDDNGSASGSVYAFQFGGASWVQQPKLLASDGSSSDNFGYSVDMDGEWAVFGARAGDGVVNFSGTSYVFRNNGASWVEEQILEAPDGAGFVHFGATVAISDGMAIVGAWHDDEIDNDAGAAYAFGGLTDCNGNGILDCHDIDNGTSPDVNANLRPDECECLSDTDGNGAVDIDDFLAVLAQWGATCPCSADADGDNMVGITDFLAILAAWGPCP